MSGNAAEKNGGQSLSTPRYENRRSISQNASPASCPAKMPEADAALPALELRERQREHHHHEHGDRIENLRPERDLEARRLLRVGAEHADVVVQRRQREPLGRHLVDGQDRRLQHRLPHPARLGGYLRGVAAELGDLHLLELPSAVAGEAAGLGAAHGGEAQVAVELVDAHADERHVGQHRADVDERQVLLEPEAGFELLRDDARRVAHCGRAHGLREALRRRRHVFAGEEGGDRERNADPHDGPADLHDGRAGRAHHGELGVRHELRDREQRADQRRDRETARRCATARAARRRASAVVSV